jgi:hypothetical protein
VADLVERLYYLKAALAILLAFIAVKMVWGELVGKIGLEILPVIVAILGGGTIASIIRAVRDRRTRRRGARILRAEPRSRRYAPRPEPPTDPSALRRRRRTPG